MKQVKASVFLDWYFSDFGDHMTFGRECLQMLETFGKVDITVEQLFESCGYLPAWIMEGADPNDDTEFDPSEVELINDLSHE